MNWLSAWTANCQVDSKAGGRTARRSAHDETDATGRAGTTQGTGRTDRVCAGRAPMSGQHAAVRKRALALRAENVATPGERARNPGTKRAVGMTDEHGRHKDILVLYPWGPTAPVLRPGRAGQRPGGRPTARRPFPADRAALGPSGGRAARRRVHRSSARGGAQRPPPPNSRAQALARARAWALASAQAQHRTSRPPPWVARSFWDLRGAPSCGIPQQPFKSGDS
ncbi:unnamed protein product [Prorocentrum cordatum]|uniref:Uncharacterized protein n=1 Tax=Prorocentrum cordatum TaxID=2364126 RepID=A0ABN9XJE2_9DINO|nr:unnamed protein product [Polarella glacialis]